MTDKDKSIPKYCLYPLFGLRNMASFEPWSKIVADCGKAYSPARLASWPLVVGGWDGLCDGVGVMKLNGLAMKSSGNQSTKLSK